MCAVIRSKSAFITCVVEGGGVITRQTLRTQRLSTPRPDKMSRPVTPNWNGEHAVERSLSDEAHRRIEIALQACDDAVVKKAWASAEWKGQLLQICETHLAWRKQKVDAVTTAEANKQLRLLASNARKYAASSKASRSDLRALQIMLGGLGSDPELSIWRKLEATHKSLCAYTSVDAASEDWSAFADAAEASLHSHRGGVKDGVFRQTITDLVNLYERVTAETFTHYASTDDNTVPKSQSGRFVLAVMLVIEPDVIPRRISTFLAELKRSRRRKRGEQAA